MQTVGLVRSLDLVLEPEPGEQQGPISLYGNVKSLIVCDRLCGCGLQKPVSPQPLRSDFISLILIQEPFSSASYR